LDGCPEGRVGSGTLIAELPLEIGLRSEAKRGLVVGVEDRLSWAVLSDESSGEVSSETLSGEASSSLSFEPFFAFLPDGWVVEDCDAAG
jgi:hypothetical protein